MLRTGQVLGKKLIENKDQRLEVLSNNLPKKTTCEQEPEKLFAD